MHKGINTKTDHHHWQCGHQFRLWGRVMDWHRGLKILDKPDCGRFTGRTIGYNNAIL